MTSYVLYRIIATIQILVFTTLAILFFNSYPITAIMIVFLAILNDGAIMTIAYDNAKYLESTPSLGYAESSHHRFGFGSGQRHCHFPTVLSS
ncbi:MAG UNVERIFIED_CONTAM: hypothetical protein LVR29_24680 [Microcystis novacekii LVE1205-3]